MSPLTRCRAGARRIPNALMAEYYAQRASAGALICLQLWHVGRVSHPMFLNGALPIAPSAVAPQGHV
ncbi:MAG: alkene reductase, partial [Steroidobacterales bacterium]